MIFYENVLIMHLWCFGTTSPLRFTVERIGTQGKSLDKFFVRNNPHTLHRNSVAADWKSSLSGFATGSHNDMISLVYNRLWIRSRLSTSSSTSDGLYNCASLCIYVDNKIISDGSWKEEVLIVVFKQGRMVAVAPTALVQVGKEHLY